MNTKNSNREANKKMKYNEDDDNYKIFKTHKLTNKKIEKRKPYHLNVETYELEECNENNEDKK